MDQPPALMPWLREAAKEIAVRDFDVAHYEVVVGNGEGEEAILATCRSDADAQLLAAGLRALLEQS